MGRECWSSRRMVEQCLFLSVEAFHWGGTFASPSGTTGTISWSTNRTGAELGKVDYAVQNDAGGLAIRVRRQLRRLYGVITPIEEVAIPITTTPCRFGGRRYWFRCPFVRDGKACGKRVGRLYLPPRQTVFGCRACHNLIHRSAREHDARQDKLARDPVALAAALGDKSLARKLAALRALIGRAQRERKRSNSSILR